MRFAQPSRNCCFVVDFTRYLLIKTGFRWKNSVGFLQTFEQRWNPAYYRQFSLVPIDERLVLRQSIKGVSNGRKIWPLLELLAKIRCVLACSCSLKFCNASARMLGFSLKFSVV